MKEKFYLKIIKQLNFWNGMSDMCVNKMYSGSEFLIRKDVSNWDISGALKFVAIHSWNWVKSSNIFFIRFGHPNIKDKSKTGVRD